MSRIVSAFAALGLMLLVDIGSAQERKAEPTPKRLGAGDHTRTIKVGDVERRYAVHIPKGYDDKKGVPVIVVFHGGGGNPSSMARLTGMNAKSEEAGFIVVYPEGTGRLARMLTFNAGACCGHAAATNVDDVAFTAVASARLAAVKS